jgi:hypothetical protein
MWPRRPRSAASSSRLQQLGVQHYRLYRISIRDDGGEGWNLRVYPPSGADGWELQCSVPGALDGLLSEARQRIDRRLDGDARHQQL